MKRATTTNKKRPARREPVKSPDAVMDPPPDPEGVAAELLGEPQPDANGDGPKSAAERMRDYRRRKKGEPVAAAPEVPQLNAQESAGLLAVLWGTAVVPLAGKWRDGTPRMNPLTDAQAERMGEVYAPLIAKYAPILGAWQLEVTALIVTVTVIRECANARPVSTMPEPNREYVEVTADADIPVAS